jgi:Protein of unknown function (DUF642)
MRRMVVAGLAGCVLGLSTMGAPAASAVTTNLVRNGGFESPVVPPGSFQGFSTGQSFSHWTVTGASGNVAVVSGTFTQSGFSFPAKSGHQWLDLTGVSNSATGVAQTVATAAGTLYTLTFSVGNLVDPGGIFGTTSTVHVLVDGNPLFTAVNSKGAGSTSQVWKTFRVNFTAASATTTIAFINGDPSNDTENALDAIKLVAG